MRFPYLILTIGSVTFLSACDREEPKAPVVQAVPPPKVVVEQPDPAIKLKQQVRSTTKEALANLTVVHFVFYSDRKQGKEYQLQAFTLEESRKSSEELLGAPLKEYEPWKVASKAIKTHAEIARLIAAPPIPEIDLTRLDANPNSPSARLERATTEGRNAVAEMNWTLKTGKLLDQAKADAELAEKLFAADTK